MNLSKMLAALMFATMSLTLASMATANHSPTPCDSTQDLGETSATSGEALTTEHAVADFRLGSAWDADEKVEVTSGADKVFMSIYKKDIANNACVLISAAGAATDLYDGQSGDPGTIYVRVQAEPEDATGLAVGNIPFTLTRSAA